MRVAVVGHVEWTEFVRVERVPAAGEIAHALEWWEEPAGGGAVVAAELARLAGGCELFTALGGDELGERARAGLEALDVRVHAARSPAPQRRATVLLDAAGERAITVLGAKLLPRAVDPLPWDELAAADAVFFVSGDTGALRRARRARLLAATSRELATLCEGAVDLDLLVGSAADPGERYRPGDLAPAPTLVVWTEGAAGGRAEPGGRYEAETVPGSSEDAYGCGDSFAAALTYALAAGRPEPLRFAAKRGALALTRRGAHGR